MSSDTGSVAQSQPIRPTDDDIKYGPNVCGEEGEGEDGSEEGRAPTGMRAPRRPTAAEREDHEKCHIPFRSWCRHCMRGKSKASPHQQGSGEEHDKPMISLDYAYLGAARAGTRAERLAEEIEAEKRGDTPNLIMHDGGHRGIYAYAVPRKGVDDSLCRAIVEDLDTMGHKSVTLKGDQEPALNCLIEVIKAAWNGNASLENSPVGESESNGAVERAIQTWEGQVRTMKDALEFRMGCAIPPDHDIMTWLVAHAATLLRRCSVGEDGRSAHDRLKARRCKRPFGEFGEKVWYRPLLLDSRKATIDPVLEEGIFVGIRDRSSEVIIMTPQGPVKSRDARRQPEEDRWSAELILKAVGTPCQPNPGSEDVRIKTYIRPGLVNPDMPLPAPSVPEVSARRTKLCKADFELCTPVF